MSMKKLLIAFGVIFFISMLGIFVFMARVDENLHKDSKEYVDRVVPLILKDLTVDNFYKYASPELKKAVPYEKAKKIFEEYNKNLGKFKKYLGSRGKAKVTYSLKFEKTIYAQYKAAAIFSSGPVRVDVYLILHGPDWYIYYFKLNKVIQKKSK